VDLNNKGEKRSIWIFPVVAAVILFVSLVTHIYASFVLLPGLEQSMLSAEQATKAQEIKQAINSIYKKHLVHLKAFSFLYFLTASILLAVSAGIYMRWITK